MIHEMTPELNDLLDALKAAHKHRYSIVMLKSDNIDDYNRLIDNLMVTKEEGVLANDGRAYRNTNQDSVPCWVFKIAYMGLNYNAEGK